MSTTRRWLRRFTAGPTRGDRAADPGTAPGGAAVAEADPRPAMVEAAQALYGSEGFRGVGAEDVAARAGTTAEAVHRAFPESADLYAAAFHRTQQEVAGLLAGRGRRLRTDADRDLPRAGDGRRGDLRAAVRPLGFTIAGALESAALYAAQADEPDAALADAGRALETLLDGLVRRRAG